ncbi:hypothetical protein O6H91_17G072500 [Diphasiastrum complanatum]|uniref:Uncharacterized protein n=1 Tax=Diphasiastrum complanatum TaxID=34168 RepID=A0ACC2B818_DIPCM|nr:hypothetical protein O6H91_17G072500 [Diphasiastrum complanatum]
MGKHTSKAKRHGKNGMKALKSNVGAKNISDELSIENCQDFKQKESAHVNISYLELRSRRLRKKTNQCTKAHHVSISLTPSKLLSMDGVISRNASFLALPQASQNVCLSNGEVSCELRDSMKMQIHEEKRNNLLCSEDCLVEYRVHPSTAEVEASIGVNDKQVAQDNVSLRKNQMIDTSRQKREAIIPYSPRHASIHEDQITNQVSGTGPDERAGRDQRVSIYICKTLFGAPNSKEEVEEFLAEAEQYEQKLLTARYKYNFDFHNGIPLKGRYKWINSTHS